MLDDKLTAPSGTPPRPAWWVFTIIGLAGGFLSGLFGIGGGIIMLPLLSLLARMDARSAASTSLAAIFPISLAGSIGYLLLGHIDVPAGLLIAVGSMVGVAVGTAVMDRLPVTTLRWAFIGLMVLAALRLVMTIPPRTAVTDVNLETAVATLALGLVVGVLSGLFGIGGGVIMVPALILLFGVSDLTARGTSLMVMIPTSFAGTVSNLRRGRVRLSDGLLTGLTAVAGTSFGVTASAWTSPRISNILFTVVLVTAIVQMTVKAVREGRATKEP